MLLALAGCASGPGPRVPPPPPSAAGYPLDAAALATLAARDDDAHGGERDRAAAPSIRYNLALESDEHGPPTVAQLLRAQAERRALVRDAAGARPKSAGLQPGQWQALGPSNVGGRVRALAFDPAHPRRLLAGTASGGLWISPDAGATWRADNDFLPNLSISALAFDPAHPAVVYAGTGEASAGLVGAGVFRSDDGGETWAHLAATDPDANPDWRFVNRIAVDPADTRVLLAGVTDATLEAGAIYRSADAGATWARVSTAKALDLAFDPADGSRALAGLDDGTLAWSRDAGRTWTRSAPLVPAPSGREGTARAEIAFARSRPGLAYASVDNARGEVWRSLDAGMTWQKRSTPGHLGEQGDYDNAIWVDPTDAAHLLVAGLDVYESRDGGATFAAVSDWRRAPASPHGDHHALVSPPDFGPAAPLLVDGNDGGVYRAANVYALSAGTTGAGWRDMNAGLAATQFYSGAGRAAAGGRIVGGTQDNGSLQLAGGVWRAFRGGDGGAVAVDPASDLRIYGEYVYAAIHRSLDGGATSSYICAGIAEALPAQDGNAFCGKDATKQANFIAPLVLDPNDARRLLVGAASLWATDDAPGLAAWRRLKPPSPAPENYLNAIAVQEGDASTVWVGHNDGAVYRTRDALAATPTWTRLGAGVLPARRVMRITTDPADARRTIVAFTGFSPDDVWETRDAGATWHSITGNLPQAPVFDVKIHPRHPAWLYAATSVGVFASEDGGASWSTSNEGPANVRVRELFWIDDATLGAATFGRGMYRIALADTGLANYQDLWWAGPGEDGWGMSIAQHGTTLFGALYVYDAGGRPTWYVMPGGTWNAARTEYTGALYAPTGAWFGAYDPARFTVGAPVGSATISFAGASDATLRYTIAGTSGTKALHRQLYGPPDATPVASYGDLWWGGSAQNGWGVAINQQYRTLFCVWYTYDAAGERTWLVVPGGTWTGTNAYTGTVYRMSAGPWLGAAYDPSLRAAHAAGVATFSFLDASHAVMRYTVDGVMQSKALERQPF